MLKMTSSGLGGGAAVVANLCFINQASLKGTIS